MGGVSLGAGEERGGSADPLVPWGHRCDKPICQVGLHPARCPNRCSTILKEHTTYFATRSIGRRRRSAESAFGGGDS